jgi:hypothetical protein
MKKILTVIGVAFLCSSMITVFSLPKARASPYTSEDLLGLLRETLSVANSTEDKYWVLSTFVMKSCAVGNQILEGNTTVWQYLTTITNSLNESIPEDGCGTGNVVELFRIASNLAQVNQTRVYDLISTPLTSGSDPTYSTTHFDIDYHLISDEPNNPDSTTMDFVQKVANYLEEAWTIEVQNWGYKAGVTGASSRYNVNIKYIPPVQKSPTEVLVTYGVTYPFSGGGTYIEINNILSNPTQYAVDDGLTLGTCEHEYYHAIQYSYLSWEHAATSHQWEVEGSAAWMEHEAFKQHSWQGTVPPSDTNLFQIRMNEYLSQPFVDLENQRGDNGYPSGLYWYFLADNLQTNYAGSGNEKRIVVRKFWESLNNLGDWSLDYEALDESLLASGHSFFESFKGFTTANWQQAKWYPSDVQFNQVVSHQVSFSGSLTLSSGVDDIQPVAHRSAFYFSVQTPVSQISFKGDLSNFYVKVITSKGETDVPLSLGWEGLVPKNRGSIFVNDHNFAVVVGRVGYEFPLFNNGAYEITFVMAGSYDFYIDTVPEKTYYKVGETTKTTVTVTSARSASTTFWLGVSFKDPTGESQKYDSQITCSPKSATLDPSKSTTFSVSWTIPSNGPIGGWQIAVNCWKGVPFTPPAYTDNLDWAGIFYVYKLHILSPTTNSPAQAGSPSNPKQVAVLTEWAPSTLLDPSGTKEPTFNVRVGGRDGTCVLVNNPGAEALGKYTLKVNPPTQATEGLYDLYVEATFDSTTDTDTQTKAVKYSTAAPIGAKIAYVYCGWGGWTMQDEINYLNSLNPQKYVFDWYNENNIDNLWAKLSDYKAILIDEDTFYSDSSWSSYGGPIYSSFRTHSTDLTTFVNIGGGIFTSGENNLLRSQTWDWLPSGMQVTSYDPESTSSVYITYDPGSPNGLYSYPNTITDSYLSGGHTHAWFTNWDKGYQVTVKRTDNNMPIELLGIFGNGAIVVSHVEAEAFSAWQYMQNQLEFIVPPTQYKMVVTSPSEGSVFKVGSIITFEAMIIDTNGNPGTGALVSVNLPDGTIMPLNEALSGSGVYQATYTIASTDPTGPWAIAFLSSVGSEFPKITVPVLIPTDTTPPTTTLTIGNPQYTDGTGKKYITSATPLTLTAEDNVGGTGVASTHYRVYNATGYDTGMQTLIPPIEFRLTGIRDGEYSIDFYSGDNIGNVEPTNTTTVILDNTPPTTIPAIGDPKYVSGKAYVTRDTPFTLTAADTGSGIKVINYRINSTSYDSGWLTYTIPFRLTLLPDGGYTIVFRSTDNVENVEAAHSFTVTLFSWNYIFQDSYGRGTTLKINLGYKFFQFMTPDKDYGIRKATYMRQIGRSITISYLDKQLYLYTVSVDTQMDFCYARAQDLQTHKCYLLIHRPPI